MVAAHPSPTSAGTAVGLPSSDDRMLHPSARLGPVSAPRPRPLAVAVALAAGFAGCGSDDDDCNGRGCAMRKEFVGSDHGEAFFRGAWGWYAMIVMFCVFNTVIGEELLLRGVVAAHAWRVRKARLGRQRHLVRGVLLAPALEHSGKPRRTRIVAELTNQKNGRRAGGARADQLLDELGLALDTHLGEQVITHDARVTHYCDRIVAISDGRLDQQTVEQGTRA